MRKLIFILSILALTSCNKPKHYKCIVYVNGQASGETYITATPQEKEDYEQNGTLNSEINGQPWNQEIICE